ncbi:MAG: hypothetical protein K2H90_03185, partial [Oscillospiraceae bacterium]|nr:hypothetical protein [Oscillospiraceae bacterium]
IIILTKIMIGAELMSTRELAYSIVDRLTDEQLEGFVLMFKDTLSEEDVPNAETEAAMLEADRIARDPNVKAYTDTDELMRDLLS